MYICQFYLCYTLLIQILVVGHAYVVVAPQGIQYWLARCVETKYKLTHTRVDDDGFEYSIGSMVVVHTWIRACIIRQNGFHTYEDYQIDKNIIHYSHLVLATNIKLNRFHGRPHNKVLWKNLIEEHEIIMDALQKRENVDGTID